MIRTHRHIGRNGESRYHRRPFGGLREDHRKERTTNIKQCDYRKNNNNNNKHESRINKYSDDQEAGKRNNQEHMRENTFKDWAGVTIGKNSPKRREGERREQSQRLFLMIKVAKSRSNGYRCASRGAATQASPDTSQGRGCGLHQQMG